ARGQYAPTTFAGKKLLAHELTHVVQQEQGRAPGGRGIVRSEALEREADNSSQCIRGGRMPITISGDHAFPAKPMTATPAVQLQEKTNRAAKVPETEPKLQTPLEQAEALVKERPATVKEQAA